MDSNRHNYIRRTPWVGSLLLAGFVIGVSVVPLAGSTAGIQAAQTQTQKKPEAKQPTQKKATPAAKATRPATTRAKPMAQTKLAPAARPVKKAPAPVATPAIQAPTSKWGPVEAGRRDPFYTPPPARPGSPEGAGVEGPLPPGKRGLIISQLALQGIVRMETNRTMIAVVANPENRAYFLRENDELYNGNVSKITADSVYFTERYRDADGRTSTREVVKRLTPSSGVNR